jgi:Ca2+:H+ antiporter
LFNKLYISKSFAFYLLLVLAPIDIVLHFIGFDNIVIFFVAAIALIPLAKLIGDSTEHLSQYYGPTAGSLLNVTFGNSAEIIISIVAISNGLVDLVKASITGSILGNILLVFGLSLIVAGIFEKNKEQSFNRHNSSIQTSMLFLAIIGLAVPTILSNTVLKPTAAMIAIADDHQAKIQVLSDIVALLLLSAYVAGIIFTFFTHNQLFKYSKREPKRGSEATIQEQKKEEYSEKTYDTKKRRKGDSIRRFHSGLVWNKKISFIVLGASMVGVVAVSEILVDTVESTTRRFGFGKLFVGAIIVGIAGNAAEHSSAIMLARKGKLDLSIGIAAGSGTQVALFVVPTLVIAGLLMNHRFTLVFTVFELIAVFLGAIILSLIAHDGKSNWFEGFMLTIVYIIFAVGFFFIK